MKDLLDRFRIARSVVVLVLLTVALPLVLFALSRYTFDTRNRAFESEKSKEKDYQGYIVEFNNKPLVQTSGEGKSNIVDIQRMQSEHEEIKSRIAQVLNRGRIGNRNTGESELLPLTAEYYYAFNGIALNINDSEAELVRTLPGVKNVYPDYKVKTMLSDSVPIIKADEVWNLTDSLGSTITGKGINIAVLDTGVDYTHPDLGATYIEPREYISISDGPLDWNNAQYFEPYAFNNGKIAYFKDGLITIKDILTGTSNTIMPFEEKMTVFKLALQDDWLVYIADNYTTYETVNIYAYNLLTNEHRKVADGSNPVWFGTLSFAGKNKILVVHGELYGSAHLYDLEKNTDEVVLESSSSNLGLDTVRADNNILAYSFSDGKGYCYDHMVVYDIEQKTSTNYFPPKLGSVLDIDNDTVLYVNCVGGDSFDRFWSSYTFYNYKTGEAVEIKYPEDQKTQFSGRDSNYITQTEWQGYGFVGTLTSAQISGTNLFFIHNVERNKIISYDLLSQTYKYVTLDKTAYGLRTQENTLCFLDTDNAIYCHEYNSNYNYPVPDRIFNTKTMGGYNFIEQNNDPIDNHGHGTHVASIAAGNGTVKGVAPDANIYAYKVLDRNGSGYTSTVIQAVEKAIETRKDDNAENDIHVINLSLGHTCQQGYNAGCGPDDPGSTALDNAAKAGIVVVVAAGNSGPSSSTIASPGTSREAITVGAVDKSLSLADFSSRGPVPGVFKPDIVAPGVSICAAQWENVLNKYTCLGDGAHITLSGTSMSAPHIAGSAALLLQRMPDASPYVLKEIIIETSKDLGYEHYDQGSGLVNNYEAVVRGPQITITPPILPASIEEKWVTTVSSSQNENLEYSTEMTNALSIDKVGKTLLFTTGDKLYRLDKEGTIIQDFNGISPIEGVFSLLSPSIGDLSGNSTSEIVIGGASFFGDYTDRHPLIVAYDDNGNKIWSAFDSLRDESKILHGLIIADLDNNRENEVIAVKSFTYGHQTIHRLDKYGWEFTSDKWPAKFLEYSDNSFIALGNIDADPELEIVFLKTGTNKGGRIYIVNHDGTVEEIPVSIDYSRKITGSLVLADIDDDKEQEIIVGGIKVIALNKDGSLVSGWPQPSDDIVTSYYSDRSTLVVGDIDGDKEIDIVYAGAKGKLYAWKKDGTAIRKWPVFYTADDKNGKEEKTVTLGDIDSDGIQEVLVSARWTEFDGSASGKISVIDGGVIVYENLLNEEDVPTSGVAIADLNGDQKAELYAVASNNVYAWDVHTQSALEKQYYHWPEYLFNSRRTGSYADPNQPTPTPLGHHLRGYIKDEKGMGVSGVSVFLYEYDSQYNRSYKTSTTTDTNGYYQFGYIPNGTYDVEPQSNAVYRISPAMQTMVLVEGVNPVTPQFTAYNASFPTPTVYYTPVPTAIPTISVKPIYPIRPITPILPTTTPTIQVKEKQFHAECQSSQTGFFRAYSCVQAPGPGPDQCRNRLDCYRAYFK